MDYIKAINAAIKAGIATLKYFRNDELAVIYKDDNSPLTLADSESHKVISNELLNYKLPILSEEGTIPDYEFRSKWVEYWLIDPLDGTKEFVNGSGEFTINIAHMVHNKPHFGIIYWPDKDVLYFGGITSGSFRLKFASERIINSFKELVKFSDRLLNMPVIDSNYKLIASKSHLTKETEAYILNMQKLHLNVSILNIGSSLKFCMIAEGEADEYPRFGTTMEWDIAAGNAILRGLKIDVIDYNTNQPILFNKENLKNGWFLVKR